MQRALRILVFVLIAGLGTFWAAAWFGRQPGESLGNAFTRQFAALTGREQAPAGPQVGIQLPAGVSLGGPFEMRDQDGRAVTQASFQGQLVVGYFGFTYCPDVCPTELGSIAAAMDMLSPEQAAKVTPVLVTVDPERDTPEQLKSYVSNFHPRMMGLTGTPEQLAEMARRFRVYYAKVNRPDMSEYLMDHSSFIYLIGDGGKVRALLRPQTSPEDIAAAIRALLPQA